MAPEAIAPEAMVPARMPTEGEEQGGRRRNTRVEARVAKLLWQRTPPPLGWNCFCKVNSRLRRPDSQAALAM